jgi:alpha-1,6-mannosyltransferase
MGVDLECLSPDRRTGNARLRLLGNFSGVSDRTVLLLYVGRMVPEKNLALLFESFAHLCRRSSVDYRLLLAGDGIEREKWAEASSREMPGRIKFLGHVKDREDLADLYANADVFVHPNPREPFGIAPLEAMASGLALVAPNVGGVSSYANDLNAWTADPNAANFSQAIEQAAAKGEARDRRLLKALAAAQRYGWSSVASSFLSLYEEMYRAGPGTKELAGAAFYSIPERRRGISLMHIVSQLAEKSFRLGAKLAMRPQPRPLPNPAEPRESPEKAPV